MMPWTCVASDGVWYVGWTAPKARGSRPARPSEKIDRVDAIAPALEFARQLLTIAKVTRRPPSVGRMLFAIPAHGLPSLKPRKSVFILSGPKYTVAA